MGTQAGEDSGPRAREAARKVVREPPFRIHGAADEELVVGGEGAFLIYCLSHSSQSSPSHSLSSCPGEFGARTQVKHVRAAWTTSSFAHARWQKSVTQTHTQQSRLMSQSALPKGNQAPGHDTRPLHPEGTQVVLGACTCDELERKAEMDRCGARVAGTGKPRWRLHARGCAGPAGCATATAA